MSTWTRTRRRGLLLTAFAMGLGLATTAPASAQSLLASRGLGLTIEALDARATGLGGQALGLLGSDLVWSDPASSTRLLAPSLMVAVQNDAFDARFSDQEATGTTARFPVLLGGFPLGSRVGVVLGYGAYLDQHWQVERPEVLVSGGDSLEVIDRFVSDGGVARFRVGGGYAITDNLAVGVGLDLYTGASDRTAGRLFPGDSRPACCSASWNYSGVGFVASALWSTSEAFRVAASVESAGMLEAEPDDSLAVAREYELPLTVSLGGSGRISSNLVAALSGRWTSWTDTDPFVAASGGAQDTWSATGGLEWDGISLSGRAVPLRAGARFAKLPFRWDESWLDERALTLGTGMVLGGGAAYADAAVERGWRGDAEAGFDESYWRVVLSLRVLGR